MFTDTTALTSVANLGNTYIGISAPMIASGDRDMEVKVLDNNGLSVIQDYGEQCTIYPNYVVGLCDTYYRVDWTADFTLTGFDMEHKYVTDAPCGQPSDVLNKSGKIFLCAAIYSGEGDTLRTVLMEDIIELSVFCRNMPKRKFSQET